MGNSRPDGQAGRVTDYRITRRAALRASGAGLGVALGWAGLSRAQPATPGATPAPTGPVSLAAKWLTNPRGFAWDEDGNLYVALAGAGGATLVGTELDDGPAMSGYSAVVAKVQDGIPESIATGLPSTRIPGERTLGLTAVAVLKGEVYVLEDANAMMFRDRGDSPDGVYKIESDGTFTLIADLAEWVKANPVKDLPPDYNPKGEVFGMVADGENLWVIESNSGQVLLVTPEGDVTRIADLSEGHPLPTGPALSPNGGIYVGYLTMVPYFDGGAKVVEVAPDGKVTDVWTGLTMITAVATDKDGTLYAAEMATGNTQTPPYVAPATGRVVRQTGQSTLEALATNVNYPVSLAVGPDNALYVGAPAMGSDDADGYLLRIDTQATGPTDVRPVVEAVGGKGLGVPAAGSNSSYFGGATPAADAPTGTTPTPAPTQESGPGEQTIHVEAGELYFKPKDITIPANVPITFAVENVGKIQHNFSIDALRVSIYMKPGETSTVTVTAPKGTYEFYCDLPGHKEAGMWGTLTVQ
jgi:plastocyanin/sugar lactone lactonase YvrE